MKKKIYLTVYVTKLIEKINQFEAQWKGTRFASINDSLVNEDEDDEQNQYEQISQKYRGKNGDVKPLGLILFKKYLCSLLALFVTLTILFVPVGIVYSFGGGLKDISTTSTFSKMFLIFSIANLPHYRLDDLSQEQLSEISLHRYLALITDIIAVVIIFIFLVYLKLMIVRTTNQYMAKSPSPNLYCLQIQNIKGCTQKQLRNHFEKFGKVAQISSIETHRDIIFDLRKIVKNITYLSQMKPDNQQYSFTYQQIGSQYKQLATNYLRMKQPEMKSAFVCFQDIKVRNRIYDIYKYQINPQNLDIVRKEEIKQPKLDKSHQISQNQDLNSHIQIQSSNSLSTRPKISKCKFQPLTINWQNCDINKRSQRLKFFCQSVLLLVVTIVILLGLFLLNISSSHIKQIQISDNSLIAKFNENINHKSEQKQRYTFCSSLSISDFNWEYYTLCSEYIQFEKNRFALMLTFSLMVAVINMLTNRILWALVAFRRYRTLAERNKFLITSIFIFSLINGAILILFIRGYYTGPILRRIVSKLLGYSESVLEVTLYAEFNQNWYIHIGSQLIMNYIVSLIFFPNFHIGLHWIRSKYRAYKQKKTQKKIKKPVFNYCTFYALSLKSTFFCLLYSNSMPIFYFFCSIALLVEIGVQKLLLKFFVDEPVFVDNNAIQVVTDLIPYSLVFHCITSIIFLNVEDIFPTESSYENIHNGWLENNFLKIQRGFVYVFLLVFISVYIWFQKRIDKWIITRWGAKQKLGVNIDRNKRFRDIKGNPAFLASYQMKDNPKYRIIYYALMLFYSHMKHIKQKISRASDEKPNEFDVSKLFEEYITKENDSSTKKMDNQEISSRERQSYTVSNFEGKTVMTEEDEEVDIHKNRLKEEKDENL